MLYLLRLTTAAAADFSEMPTLQKIFSISWLCFESAQATWPSARPVITIVFEERKP
jgi:hypothetical protein